MSKAGMTAAVLGMAAMAGALRGEKLPYLPSDDDLALMAKREYQGTPYYRIHLTKKERKGKNQAETEALRKAKWEASNG